ncbi:MAG: hypothetical protein GX112_15920 [Clostridiaceae bacterium]|nr:hypothetical protein [Clostridiaceae bacterium]
MTLKADGAIEQVSDSVITAKRLSLEGDDGIGNNLPILIDLQGGALNASAAGGRINIRELTGDLIVSQIVNTDGDVILNTAGSIVRFNADALVQGNLVDLTARTGSIGAAAPLRIDTGSASLVAWAVGSISLIEIDGDLNIISVISTT